MPLAGIRRICTLYQPEYYEREVGMKRFQVIVYGVLVVLLVLQSAFFSVLINTVF